MKKIMNSKDEYVLEMLTGVTKTHSHLKLLEEQLVVYDSDCDKNKVNLISGGGAGHEPAHAGFVGSGMLSAAVSGHIFTSPTPNQVTAAIEAVDAESTLLIIKNYTGDVLNFKIAAETAIAKGRKVDYVIVDDDVAVQNSTWTEGRRGVAGTIFVHKIAGASAKRGDDLAEVKRIAMKVNSNVRTIGIATEPCISPSTGKFSFELDASEYEFGIGIHGEPGIKKSEITTSYKITGDMIAKILADKNFIDQEVVVLINGMGGTPLSELYIIANDVLKHLASHNINVYTTKVANLMTSLDMKGFSITLLLVDEELKELYEACTKAPAWK